MSPMQAIQLGLTLLTLIFAVGVWKGRNDHIATDLVHKLTELKDNIERETRKQQEDFERYRTAHHQTIQSIQQLIGGLVTVKEYDKEIARIWKEIDRLQSIVNHGQKS